MKIDLSEGEAHILILKALNLEGDATLKKRGNVHILNSTHEVNIIRNPPEPIVPLKIEDIDDDAFIVDGEKNVGDIDGS